MPSSRFALEVPHQVCADWPLPTPLPFLSHPPSFLRPLMHESSLPLLLKFSTLLISMTQPMPLPQLYLLQPLLLPPVFLPLPFQPQSYQPQLSKQLSFCLLQPFPQRFSLPLSSVEQPLSQPQPPSTLLISQPPSSQLEFSPLLSFIHLRLFLPRPSPQLLWVPLLSIPILLESFFS